MVDIDDLDTCFITCSCGAHGFTRNEDELPEKKDLQGLLMVYEVPNPVGTFVHLSDPLPLYIDESGRSIYMLWTKKDDRHYV